MNTLTLENIDKHFSPELLALMGEWIAFLMIEPQIGIMQDERFTIRDFFEKGLISADGALTDTFMEYGASNKKVSFYYDSFLANYGITKFFFKGDGVPNYRHIKPIIRYDDVKQTFRENLSDDKQQIFPWFAYLSRAFLPRIENLEFSCDSGCYPLVETFCAEGYMARKGTTFHWTTKIRAMMEILGSWKSEQDLEADAKEAEETKRVVSILNRLYEDAFEEGLENEDLSPLIKFVKEYPTVISFTASRELGVVSVIPIIGLIMLFDRLGSQVDPDTVAKDLSETGEAMKELRRAEFRKVIEMFRPKEVVLEAKKDEPSKSYQLVWCGD